MQHHLIPRGDPLLAMRVKRQLMGFISGFMFAVPIAIAVQQGWITFGYRGFALLVLASVSSNLAFLLAIRTRFSERFSDPTLVVPQVAVAASLALVTAYYSEQATIVPLALFFSAFFFGVFSLRLRQYTGLAAVGIAAYGLMLQLKFPAVARAGQAFRLELLDYLVLAMVLVWMALLGSYVGSLRVRLSRQRSELAAALAQLKEVAIRDELTGLHNRRHLLETLDQQMERAARHEEPFSLCILDLDMFKQVNDTHGHLVGDEVLKEFAQRIRLHMRCMDSIGRNTAANTFGRYGGEEFLLLLPYAESSGAVACLERLLTATRSRPFTTSAGELEVSFSAGIAHHHAGESVDALIHRADEALYRAKSAGRDRIVIAAASPTTSAAFSDVQVSV